ncbi:hypothetical protein MPSI1_002722 [Malassezia psittaci]|uniref:26S proteasome complex subunit SEM1 n=1 Tax=Malassezia psittaci TaxID=1821823 RepID=A0AAF0FB78_9BASI|nr:hypothetical protein MPSI1_002722 [Malassezia psittaci]
MSATNERKDDRTQPNEQEVKQDTEKQGVPTLGALDEDDEFEEFEEAGMSPIQLTQDWPDSETVGAKSQANDHYPKGAASVALDMSGSARSGGDHLWEDNWDDDDMDDEFSNALRAELAKANAPEAMAT